MSIPGTGLKRIFINYFPDNLFLSVDPSPSLIAGDKMYVACSSRMTTYATLVVTCPGNHTSRGVKSVYLLNIEVTQQMNEGVCKCELDSDTVQENMYLIPSTLQLTVNKCKLYKNSTTCS